MASTGIIYIGSLLYLALTVSFLFATIENEGLKPIVKGTLRGLLKLLGLLAAIGIVVYILSKI